jgi:phage-related protein
MKDILWVGSSKTDIRTFPREARRIAGEKLRVIQFGLNPGDWKSMPAIGPGVIELRIHSEVEYRVLYIAKFTEGIYVLHSFAKKSRKTPARDIDLGRKRYMEVLRWRREKHPR